MLDISKHGEIDLSTIDMRTIAHDEWEAVKRAVISRAHAERTEVMREFLALFRSWRQAPKQRVELLPT